MNDITLGGKSKAVLVCGERLKFFRGKLGWTQEDLATRAGYCDRLIRKAESGKSVSFVAIDDIAACFSSHGLEVTLEDLLLSPRLTVRRLLEGISERKSDSNFARLIACDDVTIDCTGVRPLPLVGIWSGRDRFVAWLQNLYSHCEVDHWADRSKCAVDETVAFVEVATEFKNGSRISAPVELVIRLDLDHCQINRLHLNADSSVLQDFYSHAVESNVRPRR